METPPAPRRWNPPRLFSWDVPAASTSGVTDDPQRAIRHIKQALATAPLGSRATVKRVALGCALNGEYHVIDQVAAARRDRTSGKVVWEL
ncbi:hypothetical protein [Actinomadura hibisca]|uniref:hypothetical protein n=1 Tax=Actinomadura hibisca TaxID=68565 RepID=UPI000830FB46|nr:hypothetical protein [Actinomadura hibisca]